MVKHISFDLWGSLIKSAPTYKKAKAAFLSKYLQEKLSIEVSPEQCEEYLRETGKTSDYMAEHMGLTLKPRQIIFLLLKKITCDVLNRPIIDGIADGLSATIQKEFDALILEHTPQLIDVNASVILRAIRNLGITLNVASNTGFTSGETMDKVLKRIGINHQFLFKVYSEQVGYSKPIKGFYEQVRYRAPVFDRKTILHVGDNTHADGNGARDFGFQTFIINSNNNTLKDVLNHI